MDQSTEIAVRKASIVNSSSVVTPWLVLLRPNMTAAATMQPLTRTITTSVMVVRVSSVPPWPPNAMPARAPPTISGSASAAAVEERDTRGRDLGQERHRGQCRHALAEGGQAARQREEEQEDKRQEERERHLVRRTADAEEAAAVGGEVRPADVDRGRGPLAARQLREVGLVLGLRGGLGRRVGRCDARAAGADALVRAALDGRADHIAAVGV